MSDLSRRYPDWSFSERYEEEAEHWADDMTEVLAKWRQDPANLDEPFFCGSEDEDE